MKFLDLIILLPLLYGAYKGFKTGLVVEIAGILALVLGLILGFKLMHSGIILIQSVTGALPSLLPIMSFLLIFTVVVVGVNLLAKIFKKILDFTIFAGMLDNLAGAVVGVVKWTFGLSSLFWLLEKSHIAITDSAKEGTFIYPLFS